MKCICFLLAFFFSYLPQADADDIPIHQAKEIRHYQSFGQIPIAKLLAALDEREVIFFLATDNKIWIACLYDATWVSWPLLEQHTNATELQVQELQIDGKGNKEIIVHWDFMGKMDFLHVILKGIQIWNTDSAICYLNEYTVALEERFLRESNLQYYAGCERKIKVNADFIEITPFQCDYDLGIEILPDTIISGTFYFLNGRYRKKEAGGSH